MTNGQRIIVGYDFSEEGEVALAQGVAIARLKDHDVLLVHAGPVPDRDRESGEPAVLDEIADEMAGPLRARLGEVCARVRGQGVHADYVLASGHADEALGSAQRELEAPLLVVGTHGRSGLRWLLLGSVAERAVRTSEGAVLVARGAYAGRGGFHKILVATDFSEASERALETALSLAAPSAAVELLHCWQFPAPVDTEWGGLPDGRYAAVREDILASADDRLRALARRYRGGSRHVSCSLVERSPRQGIHRRLDDAGFDLVAVGSHGRRGVKRWLLGSVAEATVHHAACSVLVVHPDAAKAPG